MEIMLNKVIVIPNSTKEKAIGVSSDIEKILNGLGIEVFVDKDYSDATSSVPSSTAPKDADLIIVVGGDGSVIDASGLAESLDIPILGVNLGRVGYLSEVEPECLDLLSRLKSGDYEVEERMLLSAEILRADGSVETSERMAVNDVVISHDNYFGISDFRIENDKGDSIKYRADGVILSTPLGSTAYSLSAGGPIIAHGLDCIAVTPVCSHSLFNRSIIFDPNETVSVHNQAESNLNVSVDGRFFAKMAKNEVCRIKRSSKRIKIAVFKKDNMFSALFKKIRDLGD